MNSYRTNPIVLDDFSVAIDLGTILGKNIFYIEWIEWREPINTNDICDVTDSAGNPIFSETCVTPLQSLMLPFFGNAFSGIKIAQNGVSSGGKVVILLRSHRRL